MLKNSQVLYLIKDNIASINMKCDWVAGNSQIAASSCLQLKIEQINHTETIRG